MIAQLFESDHVAGQEVFSVVGNAVQPAWDERADEMRGLAALWRAHGTMLEDAVLPRLRQAGLGDGVAEPLRALQGQVVELAEDLAGRAAGHDRDGRWLADFERLKRLFDDQCLRESGDLMTLIAARLPPEATAELTRQARALRGQPSHAGFGVGAKS
ncbi:hypothetical protein [Azospirillum sp. A39]|uniref:hypothetical protein n=1 Tax=Azospirillum sp. A39 TaxID=3462279 RepID=UPI0040451B68